MVYALVAENDRPEWYALGGSRLWVCGTTVAAVAGQFGSILIGAGSAANVSVIQSIIVTGGNLLVRTGPPPVGFSATVQGVFRDSRLSGLANTVMYTRTNATSVASTAQLSMTAPGAGALIAVPPWVVASTNIQSKFLTYFESTAVNTALTVIAWGYERIMDTHEFDTTVQ